MAFFHLPPYLEWPAQFCTFCIGATWLVSVITANASQVDRLWTFLPNIYAAYYALLPLWPKSPPFHLAPYVPKELAWSTVKDFSPRALLMLGLITLWMFRLTYNALRRGILNFSEEDYRWAIVRNSVPRWLFEVSNLVFTSGIQNVLLLLIALPVYTAASQPHASLATSDYLLAGLALTVLGIEFTADNQQQAFQAYKYALLAHEKGDRTVKPYRGQDQWPGAKLAWTPADAKRGFVTRGLWRYSRHPNFACEQAFWWIITFFPLVAPSPPNIPSGLELPPVWSIITALVHRDLHPALYASLKATLLPFLTNILPGLSLTALFFSSTILTESITKKKYPAYGMYQKRVGMFQPTWTLVKYMLFAPSEAESILWGNRSTKSD